ncbi:MAG: hypothetical protein ABJA75_02175 [Bradyrhizobium sp.]
MKDVAVTCLLACMGVAMAVAAIAADASYLGTWKVSSATAAPWADPQRKSDSAEQARLIGKAVIFKTREIAGPAPFACKAAHYKEKNYTADMIFQGAFSEMKSKDKSVDPNKIAVSLGFAGNGIKTVETGCEIEFHFVDATTAEIGLNNSVYTLKKQ